MSRRHVAQALIIFATLAVPILIYFFPEAVAWVYGIIFFLAPLWLPLLLLSIAWPVWLTFIRSQFIAGIPYTTLELKPGDETPPTARAMELVFHSLYHRTEVTRLDAFLFGKVRNFWAFELYAHNGRVRFFVHLPVQYRVALEGRIRAEYHDIDIHEVRDYSREIHFNPLRMRMIAREYSLTKPDPYPLKTYIRHEESLSKRDVFGEVVEGLAHVGEKEHVLFSIIMRPHQRERDGIFEPATDSLHESAHQEIRKLVGAKGEMQALPQSTKNIVAAIEAALNKPSFDCGIRALYVADSANFNTAYENKLSTLLDAFNDSELNGFTAHNPNKNSGFFLSEIFAAVPLLAEPHLLDLYRRRAFFAPPYYGNSFVLNTEELATLFHFPHASRGSALARMRGLSLEPPENLPI